MDSTERLSMLHARLYVDRTVAGDALGHTRAAWLSHKWAAVAKHQFPVGSVDSPAQSTWAVFVQPSYSQQRRSPPTPHTMHA